MSSQQSQRGAASMPVIVGVVVVILLVAVAGYYYSQSSNVTAPSTKTDEVMMKEDGGVMEDMEDAMMKKDGDTAMEEKAGSTGYSGEVLAGTSAPLLVFNQADYDKAQAEGKLVVLYFYANWCPICKAEFPKAQAAFNQLTADDVVGFQVNFNDNETDKDEIALARQFGVPYQHTKVFVRNGQQLLKSPEEWAQARYQSEIAKYQ